MKLIRTMDNGGTAVTHGSACWMAMFLGTMDSHKAIESRAGIISGDDLCGGVDIDAFIAGVWSSFGQSGYMELRLMLCSGKVVNIDSVKDATGCQVLSVRHDQTTFPSGLTGRWVDDLTGRQSKRSKAVA